MTPRKQEYMRLYRAANKERIQARHKQWLASNRERINSARKEWMAANPDRARAIIAKQIISRDTGIPIRLIPDDLAEAKAAQLRAGRAARGVPD